MLVNKHNSDILPLLRKTLKRAFNRRLFRPLVDDEEILLRVRRVGDVLYIHPIISVYPLTYSVVLLEGRGRTHADSCEEDACH